MSHDDELLAMAGGDRALAKAVRASLERLRDGAGGDMMRDLARDVLDGRTSLRQAGRSDVYGDGFTEQFRKIAAWREEIGEEEYQRQMDRTRRQLDHIESAPSREETG